MEISENTIQTVVNYLVSRPWNEVNELIMALEKDYAESKNSKTPTQLKSPKSLPKA